MTNRDLSSAIDNEADALHDYDEGFEPLVDRLLSFGTRARDLEDEANRYLGRWTLAQSDLTQARKRVEKLTLDLGLGVIRSEAAESRVEQLEKVYEAAVAVVDEAEQFEPIVRPEIKRLIDAVRTLNEEVNHG